MGYQALLFCPDEKTARTVTHVLNDLEFTVEPCTEPFAAVKKLMAQHFDAVVVDCDNEQNATLLFKSARNSTSNQSSLAVAVVEGQAGVAKAFRIGANLVLTKPINVEQAKGTLRVARGLLRKGAEAKGAAKPSGSFAPAPSTASAPSTPSASAATPSGTKTFAPATRTVAPSAPPTVAKSTPPTFTKSTSKPTPAPLQTTRPQVAPPTPPVAVQTIQVEDHEPDTILEADDAEILDIPSAPAAKPQAQPASAPPAAGTSKFPWQPAKPMAEPMGSALQRAAEAAAKLQSGNTETTAQPPSFPTETSKASTFGTETSRPPAFEAEEERPISPTGLSFHGTASAPAPAKEKSQPVPPPAFAEPVAPKAPALKVNEIKIEEAPAENSATAYYTPDENEPTPPTFFPGAYDPDEAEGGGKIKAIVIVVMVVLLACSAAYLSWRNMSGKGSPVEHSTPTTPSPTSSAPKPDAGEPTEKPSAGQPEVSDITLGGANSASSTAKPSPSKANAKASAASTADDNEPEVTQRLIVKNDTGSVAKPSKPQDEPVQEPTGLTLGGAPDAKAIAGLNNGPAHIPTPAPQVIRVSQGVMEGLILKRVQPHYPAQAMQMRIQGPVQLQATISKTGDITNLKVVSGDGILARAAQEAVKQWKYKPYYLNGDPVEIQTQILVNFKLPN
jgi:TonB family protein